MKLRPTYKILSSPSGDWYEVVRIEIDGSETPLELEYGSNHDRECAFWTICKDAGIRWKTVEYDFEG